MAIQLEDHGPSPDLRNGKFGLRPIIGTSHFFGRELTFCLLHVVRATLQIGVKIFFLIFKRILSFNLVWVLNRNLFFMYSGAFPKFFLFLRPYDFSFAESGPLLKLVEFLCWSNS